MNIVIVEDEALVARRIEDLTGEALADRQHKIRKIRTLTEAKEYVFSHPVDLLLLDLNLNGKDGFELLKLAVSGAFHTIIISAYQDKAMEAFEYGVLDFVGKPLSAARLKKAFDRFFAHEENRSYLAKYLSVRSTGQLKMIKISDIAYIQGAGIYVDIHFRDGGTDLHDKSLDKLLKILPKQFVRIHKSYIVNMDDVTRFDAESYNKIRCILKSGDELPVSRTRYKEIKDEFNF